VTLPQVGGAWHLTPGTCHPRPGVAGDPDPRHAARLPGQGDGSAEGAAAEQGRAQLRQLGDRAQDDPEALVVGGALQAPEEAGLQGLEDLEVEQGGAAAGHQEQGGAG